MTVPGPAAPNTATASLARYPVGPAGQDGIVGDGRRRGAPDAVAAPAAARDEGDASAWSRRSRRRSRQRVDSRVGDVSRGARGPVGRGGRDRPGRRSTTGDGQAHGGPRCDGLSRRRVGGDDAAGRGPRATGIPEITPTRETRVDGGTGSPPLGSGLRRPVRRRGGRHGRSSRCSRRQQGPRGEGPASPASDETSMEHGSPFPHPSSQLGPGPVRSGTSADSRPPIIWAGTPPTRHHPRGRVRAGDLSPHPVGERGTALAA